MSTYQVYFTDDSLDAHPDLAGFLTDYSLHIEARESDVFTITVATPVDDVLLGLADPAPGDPVTLRVVVLRQVEAAGPWEYFTSGPLATFDVDWAAESGDNSDPGLLTLTFDSDDVLLAERWTYPDTTSDWEDQGAATADEITVGVPAETAIKDLANRNGGPGALAYRRTGVTIAADTGAGDLVTYRTRAEPLGDVMRSLATVGGVTYRTVQIPGPALELRVTVPVDLSASVVYSRSLGNLHALKITNTVPNATVALVGGDGTGTSRITREVVNTDGTARWRRIEKFVNNSATDLPTLDQAGRDELVADGESTALKLGATDNPQIVYGRDYNLSDLIGYEYAPGRYRKERVRGVTIDVTAAGVETVTPIIGNGDTSTDAQQVKINQRTARRLARIEGT